MVDIMAGERLGQLAKDLRGCGKTFAEGHGSLWGLSVTGARPRSRSESESESPRESTVHSNWVRYLHTPDIFEDDTTAKHWSTKKSEALPWKEGGKKAHIKKVVDERAAFWGLLRAWCEIIEGASQLIDITSLEVPAPGSQVATELIASIAQRVGSWRTDDANASLVIRLLFGGTPQSKTADFKTALARAIGGRAQKATGRVIILFGSDYRGVAFRDRKYVGKNKTWNHSKIVAADGWKAITGGHNMNAEGSYTLAPVIHDLSVEVVGHGAQFAHDFASSLWDKSSVTEFLDGYFYDAANSRFVAIEPAHLELAHGKVRAVGESPRTDRRTYPAPEGPEYVPADAVMGLGRWGDVEANGVTGNGVSAGVEIGKTHGFQYCSDHAKRLLIEGAQKSICVSQQDLVSAAWKGLLGYADEYHDACHALGRRLAQSKPIEINVVVSARYAQDAGGAPYSYGNSPRLARDMIAKFAGPRIPVGNVCTVAPLVFCRATGVDRGSYIWPDAWRGFTGWYQGHVMQSYGDVITYGFGPGNHAKALMIDDEVVLIGSDNMYPSPLAEFSFVIEGAEAVGKFRDVYWSKLWQHSRRMGLKVDHNNKVDKMNPDADFQALKKNVASDKKTLEQALKKKDVKDPLNLVQALSVIEQIAKAEDLEGCYRALRFLSPETPLPEVSPAEMFDHIYVEYLNASSRYTEKSVAKRPGPPVEPWKEVQGVKLTKAHQAMLESEEEWLDDRVMDAYVACLEQGGHVHRRYDVSVGRFVSVGGAVPVDLQGRRGGGAAQREVQVLNLNDSHWILAVRFPGNNLNAAYVYDPMGHDLTDGVRTQVRRCFGMQAGHAVTELTGPVQPGGHECGPFVCAAIELLSRQAATIVAARQVLAGAHFDNAQIRLTIMHALNPPDALNE